ncbi:FHA domain-containing protein [Variovorax sp. PAMC 28711]|uniref:FHA domain-containing protein n=1 Tax=Variovorax sp. PAMC 28711 TaxID=1795631 RepID=UPI00078C58E0|nr:FHA domain-containing protein [Variovorax sp. PAMC 28711]AMM25358.1 hypothetical protein AX767_14045 [Variovorax sp. PAMC 28711]
MAKVVLITSDGRVKQIELAQPTTTIGRADRSDIVIRGPMVSRVHAIVSIENGVYSVRDLDSSNGTFVNGVKVQRQLLHHQDVIRIGDCELRFLDYGASSTRTVQTTDYQLV